MNPRRSKSVKLVSPLSKHIEVEIEESSPMNSSVDNTVYCCVAKGSKILYSYNTKGRELETLAALCLERTPPHHKWFFHTVGTRTFGYLMVDNYTYFAIVDPSVGNLGTLRFLKHIREGFENASKNGFHDTLVPIIQRLITSLEKMPRSSFLDYEICEEGDTNDGSTSSKAPLLVKSGSKTDRKKMKEKPADEAGVTEDHADRSIKINMPVQEGGGMSIERSSSSNRTRRQQVGKRLWWRHVKIVVAVDIILCLVLFGVWLGVCKGFQCLSGT